MKPTHHIGKWLGLAAICFLACAAETAPTTYYVANSGLDTRTGKDSWDNALATISNALFLAQDGDTVLVSNGLYSLAATLSLTRQVKVQSWNSGALDRAGTVIDGNGAVRCVQLNNASVLLAGFTISNGNAIVGNVTNGGGVSISGGIVSNCLIVCNVASNEGGGAYMGSSATLIDSTISGNSSYPDNSGGVWSGGAGIRVAGGSSVFNCIISNNIVVTPVVGAQDRAGGGGVYFFAGGLVSNCLIVGNITSNSTGGGAYFQNAGVLKNSIVRGNTARQGGGLYSYANPGYVYDCVVEGNSASASVGGVRLGQASHIRNCLVRNNTGPGTGGLYAQNNASISNCTIVSNLTSSAAGGGLGIYSIAGNVLVVVNSIIYGNSASGGSGSNYSHNGVGTTSCYIRCCTAPAVPGWGEGNIEVDPNFVGATSDNYRLRPDSPCIDVGTNDSAWMDTARDLDGRRRIVNRTVDMGAFEFLPEGSLFNMR